MTSGSVAEEIGVRDIVETVLPSGDLHSPYRLRQLAQAGIDAHAKVRQARPDGYRSEVPVSFLFETPQARLRIQGRIDGVLPKSDTTLIEEIKTTLHPLGDITGPEHERHMAQAMMYGFIYCVEHSLNKAEIALTYYSLADRDAKSFATMHILAELGAFFRSVVDAYLELLQWQKSRMAERDRSLAGLPFPFPRLRKGQDELMRETARAVRDSARLFARAATGIGKTMSVLYPSVKGLAEGAGARIFYLTARGTGRTMAEESLEILREKGALLRSVTLTAREKICFLSRDRCVPEDCPFARGYYDRVGGALRAARSGLAFTREAIEAFAREFAVCPFELSLDLSLSADCIIGDYNYLFDPRVYLRRFFAEPRGDTVLLIDEAHNLIERVRSMYSARLEKRRITAARRLVDRVRFREANAALKGLADMLAAAGKACREDGVRARASEDLPAELIERIEQVRESLGQVLFTGHPGSGAAAPQAPELLDFYHLLGDFLQAAASFGSAHASTIECASGKVAISLLCLDPARFIREALGKGRAAVLFSATLAPPEYYLPALGGDPEDAYVDIPSPFPPENLRVIIDATVSTRFGNRSSTLDRVVDGCAAFTAPPGNYMIFLPSYEYMEETARRFMMRAPEVRVVVQERDMSDAAREAFLAGFSTEPRGARAGFAVLGGIFGEGIDLMGDRLTGVAIVGVGLPAVTHERELIRHYHEERSGSGFARAYAFPGLTRVLQAAGRLIRSETDRGALLLIDDRYAEPFYRAHLPREWSGVRWMTRLEDIIHGSR